jgi:acyl-CoA synthetase (AMP-forming)/AMP-acid ligase II
MSPVSFLQKPVRWLQHIAANPNAYTAGPNFAYEVVMARTSDEDMAGLDLSRTAVMINGAERVRGSTVRRFNERFAQSGDIGELTSVDELTKVLGHILEDASAGGVGADLERILPGQLHEGGDLVEDARDVILLHHGRRAFSAR